MKTKLNKLVLVALAGAIIGPAAQAQTVVTFVGGNATQGIIQDRVTNAVLQAGYTFHVNSTNSQIFTYIGNLASDSSSVQLNFNLTGGAGAISDLTNTTPTPVKIYNNTTATPNVAVSITGPGTIGVLPNNTFYELFTLASPTVFVKNSNLPNSLGTVTNLSSREASLLETYSGNANSPNGVALPTASIGGSSTTDPVYFVGRNTLSAVRQVTDANIYYGSLFDPLTTPVINWTTNSAGNPIVYTNASGAYWGASSGGEVANILNVVSNAIGTEAIGNVTANQTELSYEGVPFSVNNVINGSYPLWGVERYLYYSGQDGIHTAPTGVTLEVINNLVNAITSPTYESTSSLIVGKYVPLTSLNTYGTWRDINNDGGPIYTPPYNQLSPQGGYVYTPVLY